MSPISRAGFSEVYGILEDHLQVAAQDAALLAGGMADVLAFEADLAAGDRRQAQDGTAQGGLAGAGLPHQAQGLALADVDVDVRQGAEGLARNPLPGYSTTRLSTRRSPSVRG